MVDGRSATHFINSWAKFSRGYNLEDVDMPFLDRIVLRSSEPVRTPRFVHIEYTTKPPVLIGRTDANEERKKDLVQVTRFRCGGLCVGVAISHTMVDGRSATHFINSWAKFSRGYNLEDVDMPFLDRIVLRSSEPVRTPRFVHIEYTTKPPVLIGRTDANEERKKETSATLLKLTKEQVQVLKRRANQDVVGVTTIRPYSRYESIAGHIWRCAYNSQSTRARIGVDIRNRLKPSLPERYFGNAISATVTPIRLYEDLLSKPLSYSAGKLSWIGLSIYDADFGWGKPIYVGLGLLNMDGKS
nr:shikimate o-hydroxycinnamoyltransferase [Quercus suber]